MNLKYKILAVLAAGIALTACGSSGAPASTPASSAVPASSHVAEEGVTEPINMLTWTLDDLDREDTVTFIPAEITSGVQDGSLTAKIFSYDLYKKEDIENLSVGDKITLHEEGAAWNQFVTVAVESIERENNYVTINGGIEEGGIDLCKEEDHYRTLTWDDFPAYYEVGVVKQLVMADDIELSDGAADFGADPVMVKGDRAVCDAMSSEEDVYGWNAGNTTVTIQNGEMTHVDRIWVP